MEQRRFVLFLLIAFLILVGWEILVPKPARPPADDPARETAAASQESERPTREAPEAPSPEARPPAEETPVAAESESPVVVETERARIELTNRGGRLVTYRLKNYLDEEGGPLDLVRSRESGPYPFDLLSPDLGPSPLVDVLYRAETETLEEGEEEVRFTYRGPEGAARKVFRFADDGSVELEVSVDGETGWGLVLGPGLGNPDPESMNDRLAGRKATYRIGDELETIAGEKLDEVTSIPAAGLRFVGLEDTYFLTALFPVEGWRDALLQPVVVTRDGAGDEAEAADAESVAWTMTPFALEDELPEGLQDAPRDVRIVARASGERLVASGYFGAKEYERLAAFEGRGLQETIEWGWFGFLARPLLIGLRWIHDNLVANYGWAIVLMTIGLKLLLFPLAHRGYVSMQKMQELQPQMQAIRQKYKGKKSKKGGVDFEAQRQMNEEMQELFKREGASPTGGCWPMLLQIPVFFAFFKLLLAAVELRQEPWVLWIEDLSAPDPYYLLPIFMGATQILQQRLTPMSGDPMQRRIMQLFPWMFTIFALSFPSGLVLYWTVNNLLTIVQTSLYRKGRDEKGGAKKRGTKEKGKKR